MRYAVPMPYLVRIQLPDTTVVSTLSTAPDPPVPGTRLVVATDASREIAIVLETSSTSMEAPDPGMGRIVGPADADARRAASVAETQAAEALGVFAQLLRRDGLAARPLKAHFDLDRRRLVVWYIPPQGGIDLKPLEGEFRRKARAATLDLRAVSPREAAALLGGVGCCGRPLCCASWLRRQTGAVRNGPATFAATGLCGQTRCCHSFDE